MTEATAGALSDVGLNFLPIVFVIPDVLAVGADGNERFECLDSLGAVENTMGDVKA